MRRRPRTLGLTLAALALASIAPTTASAQRAAGRTYYYPTSATYSYAAPVAPVRVVPGPATTYAAETPASRMARYYQLGGGVGPMPGYSNGPGYYPMYLPSAGPDPAVYRARRSGGLRVVIGGGDGWGLRNGRGLPFSGRLGFHTGTAQGLGMPYGTGINVGLP